MDKIIPGTFQSVLLIRSFLGPLHVIPKVRVCESVECINRTDCFWCKIVKSAKFDTIIDRNNWKFTRDELKVGAYKIEQVRTVCTTRNVEEVKQNLINKH